MQSLGSLARSVVRILFARGSPERIQLARWTFPLSLLLAALLYGLVHFYLLRISGAQVGLSLFCALALLSMSMAWMTRYTPRRRLLQVLVAMLLISVLIGIYLTLLGLIPLPEWRLWLALPGVFALFYGLSHCLSFALRRNQWLALFWCVLFSLAVYVLYRLLDSQLSQVFAQQAGVWAWA